MSVRKKAMYSENRQKKDKKNPEHIFHKINFLNGQ